MAVTTPEAVLPAGVLQKPGQGSSRPFVESPTTSLTRGEVLGNMLLANFPRSSREAVAEHVASLDTGAQVRELRKELRSLQADSLLKPEIVEKAWIPPALKQEMQKQKHKEHAATAITTMVSEGIPILGGFIGAKMNVHEYMPQNGWLLGALSAVSYGVVWGALKLNEMANTRLLEKTGIGTDLFSKAGHELSDKESLGAKVGYWIWHSGWEAYYLATTVAIGIASNWKDAASFSVAANAIGTTTILTKTAVTNWWVKYGRDRFKRSSAKESKQTS